MAAAETDSAGTLALRYDARLYETRALWSLARRRDRAIRVNVRLPLRGVPWAQRPELDGTYREGRRRVLVEVKAGPLGRPEIEAQEERARALGFSRLVLIAPGFETASARASTELVTFRPALGDVERFYAAGEIDLPPEVEAWWRPGGIHFRFALAALGERARARRAINQTDKSIRDRPALRRELSRVLRRHVPSCVMWSPTRLLFPKDAFFRARPNHVRERALVFDVDGHAIHRAMFPCEMDGAGLCPDCLGFAARHTERLVRVLEERGHPARVVFSGRSGFHVYALRPVDAAELDRVEAALARARVTYDRPMTSAVVPIINLPGTLHGGTARRLEAVADPSAFRPGAPVGGP